MFTGNEDMEATALHARAGRSRQSPVTSAPTREPIRNYLNGTRPPVVRHRGEPDPFDALVPYVRERLSEDPHVCGRCPL